MTSVQDMPKVQNCSVTSCAYNADSQCRAGAITVSGENARCTTFVEIALQAGVERNGLVGACHRSECRYNEKLECTAPSVSVGAGADVADCLTYEPRTS